MVAKRRWKKVAGPGGYQASIPERMPPAFVWKPGLVRALSDADHLLGVLAGEGARLPNPHLLLRPFVRREAVLSSRIEGTRATLGELLAAEAGVAVERSPSDLKEVANYVAALEYGQKRLATLPLSLRLVRELHEKLMRGVRGDRAAPGEFRRSQNWIGPPGATLQNATYVPPPPREMQECLADWEVFLHDRTLPPLIHVGIAHVQFEAIHAFLDGNGRVGRLVITLMLMERGVLPAPLLYLSAFFEATRRDYYDALQSVQQGGDWEGWLAYFLNGVARQSEDAVSRVRRINKHLDRWRSALGGGSSRNALLLLERLAGNPFVTTTGAVKALKVAFTTAQRAIARLEAAGVLQQVGDARRDRVYCARALMDILDEPARLRPD